MRRAARRDANHGEIVEALRKVGCTVLDLGSVGKGCPDLLVGWAGVLTLIEVKDGSKPPCERELTPDQVKFHREWKETRLAVALTPEEAIFAARACTEIP